MTGTLESTTHNDFVTAHLGRSEDDLDEATNELLDEIVGPEVNAELDRLAGGLNAEDTEAPDCRIGGNVSRCQDQGRVLALLVHCCDDYVVALADAMEGGILGHDSSAPEDEGEPGYIDHRPHHSSLFDFLNGERCRGVGRAVELMKFLPDEYIADLADTIEAQLCLDRDPDERG